MKLCPTTGKRGWTNRADAISTLKRIDQQVGGDCGMESYLCRFCARWHLGHGYLKALVRIVRGLGGPPDEQDALIEELIATSK